MPTYLARREYTAAGGVDFTAPPYIEKDDITVEVDDVLVDPGDWSWFNDTTVRFDSAPAAGAVVAVIRDTDDDDLAVTFQKGPISSEDLNTQFKQDFYLIQESLDVIRGVQDFDDLVTQAGVSAAAAAASAVDASDFADDSEDWADLARLWAQEAEDVEVAAGEYSAYHYSLKAASDAADAAQSVVDIASAIAGKADKVVGAVAGNLASLDVDGDLVDSGLAAATVQSPGLAMKVGLEPYTPYAGVLRVPPGSVSVYNGTVDVRVDKVTDTDIDTTGLTTATLYYIYISSVGAITTDTTAPVRSRGAWYNGNLRCIGEFYTRTTLFSEDKSSFPAVSLYTANGTAPAADAGVTKFGNSITIDNGGGEWVAVRNFMDIQLSRTIMIDGWFYAKIAELANGDTMFNVDGNTNNFFRVYATGTPKNIWLQYQTGGGNRISSDSGVAVPDATWFHLALIITIDSGGNSVWGLYMDGAQIDHETTSTVSTIIHTTVGLGCFGAGSYWDGNVNHFRMSHDNHLNLTPGAGLTDTYTVPTAAPVITPDVFFYVDGTTNLVSAEPTVRIGDTVWFANPLVISASTSIASNANIPVAMPFVPTGFTAIRLARYTKHINIWYALDDMDPYGFTTGNRLNDFALHAELDWFAPAAPDPWLERRTIYRMNAPRLLMSNTNVDASGSAKTGGAWLDAFKIAR